MIVKRAKDNPVLPEEFYRPRGKTRFNINQPHILKDGGWYIQTGYTGGGAMMGTHTTVEDTARFLTTLVAPGKLIEIDDVWYWEVEGIYPRAEEEYIKQRLDRDRRRQPVLFWCKCGCKVRQSDIDEYQAKHGSKKEATDQAGEDPAGPAEVSAAGGGAES